MKYILRFSLAIMVLFFASCSEDYEAEVLDPIGLVLNNPGINEIIINANNATANEVMRLTWDDNNGGSTNYNVEFSLLDDFSGTVVSNLVDTNYLPLSYEALNQIIADLGGVSLADNNVFVRVVAGEAMSNSISFKVNSTNLPIANPVITAPASGTTYELDSEMADQDIDTITWTFNNQTTAVITYEVQAALAGTDFANIVSAGSTTNTTNLTWTTADLNNLALSLGIEIGVMGEIDVRVKASFDNGGTVAEAFSTPITISVTPYQPFRELFLVGDATAAGWENNNNNQPLFRDGENPNIFYYRGFFNAGSFKLLEVKGQWQPQWGLTDGVLAGNPATQGNDPDVFSIPNAGWYYFELNLADLTYTLNPSFPTTPRSTLAIIGSATPNNWDSPDTDMLQSTFDAHKWYLLDQELTAEEMKFRSENSWAENWGGTTPISGLGEGNGENNIPVSEAGIYDIYFDTLLGRYHMIKKD